LHPDIKEITNAVVDPPQVLPLLLVVDVAKTAKFIPIPLFLVPIILNHKHGLSTVEAFQAFYDEFYDKALVGWCRDMEFILNFLLVAAGYDTKDKQDMGPISQLVILMEEVALDSIITQWASAQFGGIKHIIALQDAAENLATSQEKFSFHCDQDESKSETKDLD